MSDLAAWLLQQIAEDEELARAATPGPWTNDGGIYAGHETNQVVDWVYDNNAPHITRHDPACVLAECDAKRRIVEMHDDPAWSLPTEVLHLLALPYADRPGYRDEWRP